MACARSYCAGWQHTPKLTDLAQWPLSILSECICCAYSHNMPAQRCCSGRPRAKKVLPAARKHPRSAGSSKKGMAGRYPYIVSESHLVRGGVEREWRKKGKGYRIRQKLERLKRCFLGYQFAFVKQFSFVYMGTVAYMQFIGSSIGAQRYGFGYIVRTALGAALL